MQEHLPQDAPQKIADLVEFVAGLRRLVKGIMEKELRATIRDEIKIHLRNILTEAKHV